MHCCPGLQLHGYWQLRQWHPVPTSLDRPQMPHLWADSCMNELLARCTLACGCPFVKHHAEKREGLGLPQETACGVVSTLWMSAGDSCELTCLRSWLF